MVWCFFGRYDVQWWKLDGVVWCAGILCCLELISSLYFQRSILSKLPSFVGKLAFVSPSLKLIRVRRTSYALEWWI